MSILEKLKAARAAAMKTEGKTKVKGTMSSEVDGKNYTSKGVIKSKTNSLNNTTKTVTKLKGGGYDNPIQKSRSVVVKNADGTVKRTNSSLKFKKNYESKDDAMKALNSGVYASKSAVSSLMGRAKRDLAKPFKAESNMVDKSISRANKKN